MLTKVALLAQLSVVRIIEGMGFNVRRQPVVQHGALMQEKIHCSKGGRTYEVVGSTGSGFRATRINTSVNATFGQARDMARWLAKDAEG